MGYKINEIVQLECSPIKYLIIKCLEDEYYLCESLPHELYKNHTTQFHKDLLHEPAGKYKFSKRSKTNLCGVNTTLISLSYEVLSEMDIVVICGLRTAEEQHELYLKGASQLDGYNKRSHHMVGKAIDVCPYPINWQNIEAFEKMGELFKTKAKELNINITWGGDWVSFRDYPHIQIN